MDTIDCIHAHRSIRKYRSDPIPDETLETILRAATRASSSGNMQTYSIVVTKDAERRARLWEMHFRQDMITQAPVLLTFCADWNRMNRWCRARDADPGYDNFLCFLVAAADAFIAAQNAALAAESQGLGICYMGTTLCATPELIQFFGLPRDVFPVTTLVVGHPDEDPAPRARLPLASIIHHERYEDFDDDRITETYGDREVEGWDRYMSFPDLAERIRKSGVENLAQVYTEVKYTRASNLRFSRDLLRGLERQGFLSEDP
jgi:nitroreductase